MTGRDLAPDAAVCRAAGGDEQAGLGALHARSGRRPTIPPMSSGIARFVAPMKNVEWVEVQPFHQMGAFKWKAMGLDYKHVDTPAAAPELVKRVIGQFRAAGCRVR